MLWMNAFPMDPLYLLQNYGRLDSMRLRDASAAVAQNPGPISTKIAGFLGWRPWEVSGPFMGLP